MQQLNELSNDFLSQNVNSYDDCAPISEATVNLTLQSPLLHVSLQMFVCAVECVGRCEESVTQ